MKDHKTAYNPASA